MKVALWGAAITLVLIATATAIWFAVSPNLCTISETVSGQPGALLIQSGRIIGGPAGEYIFECDCPKYAAMAGLDVSPAMLASFSTRRNLAALRNEAFHIQERSAKATIVAVLTAHSRSCFTSGIIVRPAVLIVGVPKTTPRPPRHDL